MDFVYYHKYPLVFSTITFFMQGKSGTGLCLATAPHVCPSVPRGVSRTCPRPFPSGLCTEALSHINTTLCFTEDLQFIWEWIHETIMLWENLVWPFCVPEPWHDRETTLSQQQTLKKGKGCSDDRYEIQLPKINKCRGTDFSGNCPLLHAYAYVALVRWKKLVTILHISLKYLWKIFGLYTAFVYWSTHLWTLLQ